MNRKYVVVIVSLVVFSVFLIVGLQGVSGEVTLQAGDCEKCYTHYYVEPFISDYFICMTTTPCGIAQEITIHNTKIDIIECLCKDIEKNHDVIIDYYNTELAKRPFAERPSDDAKFICQEGATKIGRM